MPLNAPFDPFANDPQFTDGSTNPAVLVDKMIGTAYDVVRHVCRYMEQVRHVSAHMEQVYRVSGDLENLAVISNQIENLELIADNMTALLALAGPQTALDARLDVVEANYVTEQGGNTIAGTNRFSGYLALGPAGATQVFPAIQMRSIELTGPSTDATVTVNANLNAAERARVIGIVPILRTSTGHIFMANHATLTVWLSANTNATDLMVNLAVGHPTGYNTAAMSVLIFLKAP